MIDQARSVLLVVHALAGTLGLIFGVVVLLGRPRTAVAAHLAALLVMLASLVPSLTLGWARFPPVTRVIFAALAALSAVMLLLALRAWRSWRHARGALTVGQVDLLGFNVIALSVAGTIVPLINLTGQPLAVAATVAPAFVLARWFVQRQRAGVSASAS